jgi:hypothetical protein
MIFTARQLEDLHRTNGNGQLVLPYGARMTPLAADWIKNKKIKIGYGPDEIARQPKPHAHPESPKPQPAPPGAFLWWCDGPCGAAKAAIAALAKDSSITPIDNPTETTQLVPVIKRINTAIQSNQSTGALLLLQSAAPATVLANRCPALRAIVGTTFESLEAGIAAVAPNVLILEYPRKSFSEIRNLLSRFVRAQRNLPDDTKRQLEELASCA